MTNNFDYESSRTSFDAEHVAINVRDLDPSETTLLKFRLELTPYDMALATATVMENTTGSVIGALTVADLNDADTHTFNVSDTRFEVVDGMLKLRDGVALNYEADSAIDVTVTATDSFGLSYDEVMTIDITDGVDRFVGDKNGGKLKGTNGDDILRGRGGDDILLGKGGDDILLGKGGDDRFKGGNGADTFVFSTGSRRDTIADFAAGIDRIDLSKWKAIDDFADMKDHARNHGDDVWITAGKDILVIQDMHRRDLDAGDFLF